MFGGIATLPPLPGNPRALEHDISELERSSRALEEATEMLATVALDGRGETMEALRESSSAVADDLRRANGRYAGTAAALRPYVVVLASAQSTSARALEINHDARVRYDAAERRHDDAKRELLRLELQGSPQPATSQAEDEVLHAHLAMNAAEQLNAEARSIYVRAERDVDEAAHTAMAAINASFDGTNDSNLEEVLGFFAPVGDFLKGLVEWVGDFFASVIKLLATAVALVTAALLLAIAVVALLALLMVALALAVVLLAAVLQMVTTVLLLWGVTEILGVPDLLQLKLVALAIGIMCPLLGGYIVGIILSDVTAPTPEVREVHSRDDLDARTDAEQDGYTDLTMHDYLIDHPSDGPGMEKYAPMYEPFSPANRIAVEGMLDAAGKNDQTVVSIEHFVDETGQDRWVVTLPSTQEWNLPWNTPFDGGAVNDLGGNLAMMLVPELRTQYERAVVEAMHQAGIQPDDPVMMVGFSQGGILAGLMTERYGGTQFNIDAVLTAGSPIEGFRFPDDVAVLAVENDHDIVHQLDLHAGGNPSNLTTLRGDAQTGTLDGTHSTDHYAATIDSAGPGVVPDVFKDFQPNADDHDWERNLYAFSE